MPCKWIVRIGEDDTSSHIAGADNFHREILRSISCREEVVFGKSIARTEYHEDTRQQKKSAMGRWGALFQSGSLLCNQS